MTRSRLQEDLAGARRRIIARRPGRIRGRVRALVPRPRRRTRRRLLASRMFQRRSLVVVVLYLLAFLLTAGQLVRIQVLDAADYAARSADQRERLMSLPADRGRIYDRGGEVLAASVAGVAVVADPRAFRSGTAPDGSRLPPAQWLGPALEGLTEVLGIDRARLRDQLTREADFVFLARQQPPSVGEAVMALGLEGVGLRSEPRRSYPGGSLGAQVIGITDIDGAGIAGMELHHDRLLAGQPGWLDFERGADGRVITVGAREVQTPVPGTDVVLTLDRQLQYTAERVAADVVEEWDAAGASIVVLEVGTGDVLAMASAPLADLGDRDGMDAGRLRNRAVTDVFEPGSVQKAITVAAALEQGVVTADTTFEVPYSLEYGSSTFTDSHYHPTEELTVAEILEESSNVGTIMMADRLGDEALASWLARFGYGRPTVVGFPGEAGGMLRPVEEWWRTSLPTIAIGQGVAVTLLQQAHAYATIANDGVAVQPRLVRGVVDPRGRLVDSPSVPGTQVVSAATAQQVRRMLTEVVEGDRGTGGAAALDGYAVAGKTGTARKPSETGRGYAPGKYVANFTGMAPAGDPSVVVAVMVDEPSTIWGGVVAAPAFAEVMAEALRRQHVPPTATAGPSVLEALDTAAAERARIAAEAAAAERELRARREQLRIAIKQAAKPATRPAVEPATVPSSRPSSAP